MLVRFQELRAAVAVHKQHQREFQQLRAEILDRAREGAPIEAGPLSIRIIEREYRAITKKGLVAILGNDDAEALRTLMPPTENSVVEVVESSKASFPIVSPRKTKRVHPYYSLSNLPR